MPSKERTQQIWDKAARSIHPTDPIRPGYAWGLHPKMQAAMGRLGWEGAATLETDIRRRWLVRQERIWNRGV